MAVPDFRKIFKDFRSNEETKNISNAAVFKLLAFLGIAVAMMGMRKVSMK